MFAEKSGNILKNTFTKTEIKNKETNLSISMKINTIWALKKLGFFYIKQIINLKIAEYFLKKWEFILAIKSQRYLSTFCSSTKPNISGIFFTTI